MLPKKYQRNYSDISGFKYMHRENEHPIIRFFKLLWEYHREAFVNFFVAVLLILASAMSNRQLSWLETLAIAILSVYLLYVLIDTYRAYKATSINIHSGYSICLDQPVNSYQDAIRNQVTVLKSGNTNWSVVTKYFRILDIDWQYYDGTKSPPTSWQNNIADISRHFFRYARLLPRHTSLHIFLMAPPIMALGIGHTIGRNRNWNVYQYVSADDSYILLPKVKNYDREELTFVTVEDSCKVDCSEVTVILAFTPLPKENFAGLGENQFVVKYNFQEHRIQPEHFYRVAEEISFVIDNQVSLGRRVRLYPGLPNTLSFILGSRIQEDSPVSIHNRNYESGKWELVFQLDQLKSG